MVCFLSFLPILFLLVGTFSHVFLPSIFVWAHYALLSSYLITSSIFSTVLLSIIDSTMLI